MRIPADNTELDENDPIVKAIDLGGGQCCDVAGVIRELDRAGLIIVEKATLEATLRVAAGGTAVRLKGKEAK